MIYAEASEQMLGMGDRELHSKLQSPELARSELTSPISDQEEVSEADYAEADEANAIAEADVTTTQILLDNAGNAPEPGKLTPSSSFNNPDNAQRNIPRSPRMDWSSAVSE
jgi:hypothetical protein